MKQCIKVLNLLHYPNFNGPANTCLLIDKHLKRRGIEPVNVIPEVDSDYLRNIFSQNDLHFVPVQLSRLSASLNPKTQLASLITHVRTIITLRRIIKELEIDVVIVNGMENPHGAIAARLEKRKVVGQMLGLGVPIFSRVFIAIWSSIFCHIGMMPGKSLKKYFPGFLPESKCVFFVPPVDSYTYSYKEKDLQYARLIGIDTSKPVVGTVGNINPAKDYMTFVDTAAEVLKVIPNTQFLIKGNVPTTQYDYFQKIKKYAKDSGLQEGKQIFYSRDNQSSVSALSLMDVYYQSSAGEGISTALLEAMAMERPVVATDVGATIDVVKDGSNGYVVSPKSPSEASSRIINLLNDSDLAMKIALNGCHFVTNNATVERCANAHVKAVEMAFKYSIQTVN